MKNIFIFSFLLLCIFSLFSLNCAQEASTNITKTNVIDISKPTEKGLEPENIFPKNKEDKKVKLAKKDAPVVQNPFEAKNAVTFPVCEVEKATELRAEVPAAKAIDKRVAPPVGYLERLAAEEARENGKPVEKQPEPETLCFNSTSESLIECNANPFVEAVYLAHAQHRPLVISPDMIWLIITQGFAIHVNENAESLRYLFVDFEEKKNLDVQRFSYHPHDKKYWEAIFPDFSQKIKENTHKEIMDLVVADFSTTGIMEKAAFEITLMDGMSKYFQYSMSILCGIPEITLEGTVEDWKDIKTRTEQLQQYQLEWWTNELLPVLDQFIQAVEDKNDSKFWASIYDKKFVSIGCASEPYITGWILKFFPYIEKDGNYSRNPWIGKKEKDFMEDGKYKGPFLVESDFPSGLSKADVLLNNNGAFSKLKFYAGFTGIKQDAGSMALRPEISWAVVDTKKSPTMEEMELYEESVKGSLPAAKKE